MLLAHEKANGKSVFRITFIDAITGEISESDSIINIHDKIISIWNRLTGILENNKILHNIVPNNNEDVIDGLLNVLKQSATADLTEHIVSF